MFLVVEYAGECLRDLQRIVTTDMAKAMFEQEHIYNYVFGLEESYGCLAGTYARDKDACVAVMMP